MFKHIKTGLELLVILGVGFFLRVYKLAEALPVFADEAIYVRWAQVMWNRADLRFLPLTDGKQPLFMWAVIPFLKFIDNPLLAGRLVSALAGIGTALGVFVLTYILFKSLKAAKISAIIWCISPFAVFFDRMALSDSLLALFGVWTIVFVSAMAIYRRLDLAMIAGFFLGFALLTKSPALFFSLLIPSTFLLSPKGIVKFLLLLIPVYAIGYGMYNILRLGPEFHQIALRNLDYVFPINHLWTNPRDPFVFYIDRIREWIWILGPSTLIWLAILGFANGLGKNRGAIIVLSLFAFLPLFIQAEFAKVITARYILFTIPFLAILASSVFLIKNKLVVVATNILFVIFVIHALAIDKLVLTNVQAAPLPRGERSGYLEEWTSGTGIVEIANILKGEQGKNPEKKIVVGTEGYFGTLPDGLQMYLADTPQITVVGIGLGVNTMPKPLEESFNFGNKTYLVINSSRFFVKKEDWDKEGFKLVESFKKADRPEDIKEYWQFGPSDYLYLFEIISNGKNLQ